MTSSTAIRLVFAALLGASAAVAACRSTPGPKPAEGSEGPNGAAAQASAPRSLFEEERPTGRLVAFKDEADLKAFHQQWKDREEAEQGARQQPFFPMFGPKDLDGGAPPKAPAPMPSAPAGAAAPAPAAPPPPPNAARSAPHTGESPAAGTKSKESITNNQHAAVDEGDIVKLHGDHLVVLRRGRLFTLSLKGEAPKQTKMLDAFGPDIDPAGSWYDEMVVEENRVIVVGFSYARGGTEIGLFEIDDAGQLKYRATYHLRSNDYYSARNYASRIVDGRLVFYAPLYVSPHETDLVSRFPAVRHWKKGARETDFIRTLTPTRLYHLEGEFPSSGSAAFHTVTSCDLRSPTFECESVAVLGPPGRVFYVSPSNVYVWTQDWARQADKDNARGLLLKLPITRARAGATAVRVAGMPTDQFSFEEEENGTLDVFVRSESNGDAMFGSERTGGGAALARFPRELFSDGVPAASSRRYRTLPRPDGYTVQNRFVGSWLLYGAGQGYVGEHQGSGQLYAVRYTDQDDPSTIVLDQGIDRIEPMGEDAIVVGARGEDLVFTPIELAKEARPSRDYVRKKAGQGELRSHGFFYKPGDKPREGIVGLPIRGPSERGGRYLLEGSASVLFLSHRSLALSELGELRASPLTSNSDGCRASCVDWYGNARPIFAKNRIFALMGYDLVEGRLDTTGKSKRLTESAHLSFAPKASQGDAWR